MAYGLKVWDANGNIRLDIGDRECRFVAFYTGTVAAGATITIPVAGLSTDGTWGLNELQFANYYISLSVLSGAFRLTNSSSYQSHQYKVQVFRI
tara:strand:+ start:10536 stop:10817 length:282 start_codon:yes stop_codon:yes gene_type:complete